MDFIPHIEISPDYEDEIFDDYDGTQKIATNSYLRDGNILYLMGGTVLFKSLGSLSSLISYLQRTVPPIR